MFEMLGKQIGTPKLNTGAENKFSKFFMEPTEKFICALGNSFLKNFLLDGSINYGFAVVSDKRVYFKGRCFTLAGWKYRLVQEERVVDVKDVTGTGYTRITPFKINKAAIIATITSLPMSLVLYIFFGLIGEFLFSRFSDVLYFIATSMYPLGSV